MGRVVRCTLKRKVEKERNEGEEGKGGKVWKWQKWREKRRVKHEIIPLWVEVQLRQWTQTTRHCQIRDEQQTNLLRAYTRRGNYSARKIHFPLKSFRFAHQPRSEADRMTRIASRTVHPSFARLYMSSSRFSVAPRCSQRREVAAFCVRRVDCVLIIYYCSADVYLLLCWIRPLFS